MKRQAVNPYMPPYEYIPDGEPHVFGNRVYVYGSHDRFGGADFCLNDYVCYSAPVDDLTDWRYEGVIYRKEQDPGNQNIPEDATLPQPGFAAYAQNGPDALNAPGVYSFFAPDVAQGPDGRYYLFYCPNGRPGVSVAVCDTPAGAYAFLDFVRYPDGTVLACREGDPVQFDPGVFVDDDGEVYLFSGNAPMHVGDCGDDHYSQVMRLEKDMITLKEAPRRLLPDVRDSAGTGYENHEFFEASSIRKVDGKYYFIYSSVRSHELCWAVSDRPDADYCFGGTLVDIGDVYLNGRTEAQTRNCLGNTHGSVEKIGNEWYVFYHRQTNRTQYSRQACAEKITFENGRFHQAEVTSCGLNGAPLEGRGEYGAYIACELTRHGTNAESRPYIMRDTYPFFTQDGADVAPDAPGEKPVQYVANLRDDARVGFKYFAFAGSRLHSLTLRGRFDGMLRVYADENPVGEIALRLEAIDWTETTVEMALPDGTHALCVTFAGKGVLDWKAFSLLDD